MVLSQRMQKVGWWLPLLLLIGCSNGRGSLEEQSSTPPPVSTTTPEPTETETSTPPPAKEAEDSGSFLVGGTVNGLTGKGLILRLNGGHDLSIPSSGAFNFATRLPSGTEYNVTVRDLPSNPSQTCAVEQARGTIAKADVTSVRVTCGPIKTFTVAGQVSGLYGTGLVLQNNGGDDVGIDSDGKFVFPTKLPKGSRYDVRVFRHPTAPSQSCSVTRGTGTIGDANIDNVAVSCAMTDYTVGGSVSGLSGGGLVLLNNGVDAINIDSNGSFTFPTSLPTGAKYNVTIGTQPSNRNQTCSVSAGAGTVGSANVTSVRVTCVTPGFRVGGRVSKLEGSGLVLQNNGGDDLPIASNGPFWFVTTLPSGSSYNITVRTQPRDRAQTCEVRHGSGIVRNSDVKDIDVRCKNDGRGKGGD